MVSREGHRRARGPRGRPSRSTQAAHGCARGTHECKVFPPVMLLDRILAGHELSVARCKRLYDKAHASRSHNQACSRYWTRSC